VLVLVWLVLVVGVFYVLLWRPQQRRMQAARRLQSDLRVGDEVITTSGIYGRIVELHENELQFEIAPGTVVRLARGAVGERLNEPEHDGADPGSDSEPDSN
jgi:preprotein translocase subunit YajC